MKCLISLLLIFTGLTTANAKDLAQQYIGRWQSDEAKTLADMARHPEIPEKTRALFNQHFFGRLVIIVKKNRAADFFIEDGEKKLTYIPYKVIREEGNQLVIQERSKLTGKLEQSRLTFEEGCYYQRVTKWQFREYFCKVD